MIIATILVRYTQKLVRNAVRLNKLRWIVLTASGGTSATAIAIHAIPSLRLPLLRINADAIHAKIPVSHVT